MLTWISVAEQPLASFRKTSFFFPAPETVYQGDVSDFLKGGTYTEEGTWPIRCGLEAFCAAADLHITSAACAPLAMGDAYKQL